VRGEVGVIILLSCRACLFQDPNSPPQDCSSGGSSPHGMQDNGSEDPISDNNVTTTNELSDAYEVPLVGGQTWAAEEEVEVISGSPHMMAPGIPVRAGGMGHGAESSYFPHPNEPSHRNRLRGKMEPNAISPFHNGNQNTSKQYAELSLCLDFK